MPHSQSRSAKHHHQQALFYRECDLKQDLSIAQAKVTSHNYNNSCSNSQYATTGSTTATATATATARTQCISRTLSLHGDEVAQQTPIHKIEARIAEMTVEDYAKEKIVLLLTGSFCPIHLHHTEMLEAAKIRMEQELGQDGASAALILGGFLSPSHDLYVGEKLKGEDLVLNSRERMDLCRLQTADSDWIDVDPWESTQDRFFDYHKVTSRLQQYLQEKCQSTLESKMDALFVQQQQQTQTQEQMQHKLYAKSCSQMVPQRSGSLSQSSAETRNGSGHRNPYNIRVVYLCGADFVLRTGARKLVGGIVVVDRPLGAPSSNRRSILLTDSGGSITVPVSNQVEKTEDSTSTSTTASTLTPKQRVFKKLEQSYGSEWCEASRNNIWWLPARSRTESEDISSTRIRGLLSDRKSCKGLLHPLVAQRLLEKKTLQDSA
ncbi:Nicotinamide/nicotinic acid mononucleotide adenylyltransferase 2 [Mortierella sp. GBA30]|nr:Nicotinamide/nicotinic acid mononucleotide adenylyltransferase 2 [Mortierella sp. GBA30]